MEAGIPGIVRARLGFTKLTKTIKPLLQKGRKGVLLILDEAQTLASATRLSSERHLALTSVLNAIHHGELEKPVLLLFAGLGRTRQVLETLGISRFGAGAFLELGALDKKSERSVLYDWLTRDGGARETPAPWIDAIVQGGRQVARGIFTPGLSQNRT